MLVKGNSSCKSRWRATTKLKLDLYYVKTNSYTNFEVNFVKDSREKPGKLNVRKGHVKEGQAWRNSNLICITSRSIYIPTLKSISQKTAEKIPENQILAKCNNFCKNRSSVTKLELDLYQVKTNLYTTFQFNISKDCREKSGKLNFIKGNNSCKLTKLKLDLIMSWQAHIPHFKSISQKTAEKSLENWSVTDGHTDWQTATKLKVPGSQWEPVGD